jgi:superfamily II DNA or RNA helicase
MSRLFPPVTLAPVRHPEPFVEASPDEARVAQFERAVRGHRAHVETFTLSPLSAELEGAFDVRSGSGIAHVVDLVDRSGLHDTCSCPDFLGNMLGTCKHLEAVRRGARESSALRRMFTAMPHEVDVPTLTVHADGELELAAVGPGTDAFLHDLGVRTDPEGTLSVSSGTVLRSGRSRSGRVTHAAAVAAGILCEREGLAVRSREVKRALQSGALGLDVLSAPLFPYQREGVAHLVAGGRALLADDMGLGKTVQTIAACEVLRRRGEARRVLVVCPASLKAQWASEIKRYAGERAVVVVGGVEQRRAAFASDAPYVVLNYELTWRDLSLLRELHADVLILDEAQRAKNFRTKTAATLKSIPSRFLFVLTGTPVENRLDDLYGLLQIVDPTVLGPLWKFNVDFHERDDRGKIAGYKNLGALRARVTSVVMRRRKDEVLSQLPPLTEQTRYVPMSTQQKELDESYRRAAAQIMKQAERRPLTPAEQKRLLASLLKARQACNAAFLCDPHAPRTSAKLDELAALVSEIAQQGTNKVLVFSEWTEMLKLASERLTEEGIGHLMLHGGVPSDARPGLLDRFREDPNAVVLLSTDAGGVGLNLQVASYVVHLDLPWNPGRLDQRVGRAHRLGQTRGVSVTYLCAESGIERGIEGTLSGKRAVRAAAVDPKSDVESLEAPTFSMFLEQARGALLSGVDDEEREVLEGELEERIVEHGVPSAPEVTQLVRSTVTALTSASASTGAPAFALQRMRLAHVVLDAGFPADAVRAAYEAMAACLRNRLATPTPEQAGHTGLVAAVYRELLPAGLVPAAALALLARVHDLVAVAELGVDIDADVAASIVTDVREWVDRWDASAPGALASLAADVAPPAR